MAGVKITDLDPLLTTPDSGDLLYIVDISDTTESPQGTSKKIEVSNLLDFESGTWTPTFSGESGSLSNVVLIYAMYSRVGSIVTCTIRVNADLDFSSSSTGSVSFTLPIASTTSNAIGSVSYQGTKQINGYVRQSNLFEIGSEDTTLVESSILRAVFQYEIV
jgi:hypothetical protein